MKTVSIAIAFALATAAAPVFAQDSADLTCEAFSAMDNAGQMAVLADLQAVGSEMASNQEMTNEEIHAKLVEGCTASADAKIMEVYEAAK